MDRQRHMLLALAGAALFAASLTAQAQRPNDEPAAGQAPAPKRLSAPVRGSAELGYTKPVIKAAKIGGKEFIVTTFKVKNLATGAIAGLKVDEFWYNKAGDPVTGDNYRHPRPLQPGEVITVTLETPRTAQMDRNQYKFEHANGTIKMTLVPKL